MQSLSRVRETQYAEPSAFKPYEDTVIESTVAKTMDKGILYRLITTCRQSYITHGVRLEIFRAQKMCRLGLQLPAGCQGRHCNLPGRLCTRRN